MSGGAFNYLQFEISRIYSEIEERIRENEILDSRYSQKTIEEFKTAVMILREAFIYSHRIDWLLSADDSEDAFHTRLKEDLLKLSKREELWKVWLQYYYWYFIFCLILWR